MSTIGTIGAVATLVVLFVGVITVLNEAGYSFDLRNKKSGRLFGGRRQNDRS